MHKQQRLSRRISHWSPRGRLPFCLAVCVACGCSSDIGGTGSDGSTGSGDVAVTARILSVLANASISINDPDITIRYTVTGIPDSISPVNAVFVAVENNGPDAPESGERQSLGQNLPASGVEAHFKFLPDGPDAGVGFYRVGIIVTIDGQVIEAFSDGVIQVQGGPDPCFSCSPAASGAPANSTFGGCGGRVCELTTEVAVADLIDVSVVFDAGDPQGGVRWRLFYLKATESCDNPANPTDQLGIEIATNPETELDNVATVPFPTVEPRADNFKLGVSVTDSGLSVAETVVFDGDYHRIVTVCGPVVKVVP